MPSAIASPFFTLTDGATLAFAGAGDRYQKNLAAIQLLRKLQQEQRAPHDLSDSEHLTLAHYSAFGESSLLRRAFGDDAKGDLDDLVSDAERNALKRASLNAFYTSQEVLEAKWAALTPLLEAMPGPIKVLEPAFGVGNYIASMPLALRQRAQITAVELDKVSSQIAAYLHPDVTLYGGQGFEETELPEGEYDLVISNVPFGNDKIFDPRMAEDYLTRTVHDYFIARSLTLVRPGGVVAVITSYGTLDKRDTRVRAWIAQRARLLRAVRLPQGAFRANAGTECGADILIFRRYTPDEQPVNNPTWIETAMLNVPLIDDDGSGHFTFASKLNPGEVELLDRTTALLRMGQPFAAHPEQIAGATRVVRDGEHLFSYVAPLSNASIAEAISERLADLPIFIHTAPATAPAPLAPAKPRLDASNVRIAGLLAIYAAAKQVIRQDVEEQDASAARAELNTAYDTFVAAFGPIHARANQLALKGEPELLFLKALEYDVAQQDGVTSARKAPLFSEATVRPVPRVVEGSMTADEALIRCLDELGRVDIGRIAQLSGETESDSAAALQGRIYRLPESDSFVTADEYLSGNIRTKLAAAEQAVESDPQFAPNAEALRAMLPAPLTPGQIAVKFGAPWVPEDIYVDFVCTLIPSFYGYYSGRGKITYVRKLAKWVVADEAFSRRSHAATVEWGTGRIHAIDIIEKGLNNQTPAIYDETQDGGRVLNQKETLLAREKLERIKESWAKWIWEDAGRTERLCQIYNELFNSSRRRDFSGAHLSLPGINTTVLRGGDLAAHQKDAVWMILQTPSVLLDLCVGAGKTFIMLAAAHELKRLGLARKILITVPNHLTEQWASEANRLYPDMRVLAMSADDFAKERRGTFLSRIATEEWDVIICAHTSFGFIETGRVAKEFIQIEVDELRFYLEEMKRKRDATRADKRTMKEIERKILAFENRLKEQEYRVKHDDARIITWDELGIDALMVDEAHEFKNLSVPTMLGSLPGVPKGDSKRAFDMRIKTWDLRRRGGRVVFATGTPVLNTLGEVFIMQKYLQEDVLAAHGIEHFDAWASTFAETQTVFEMTPDGGGFRMNTRLCKFVNLPELFNLWFQMTFSRSREQLGLPTPKLVGGRPIPVSVPGSPTLKALVGSFVRRVEAIKSGAVEPWEDNMLKVTSDGRKAALDVRLVAGGPEEPACKINMLVNTVAELHQRYDAAKATQLIYCELSTPKPKAPAQDSPRLSEAGINDDDAADADLDKSFVYHEIRAKLAARGIPAEQVAFIQEHNTKTRRAALFAALGRGDVRVLIASKQSTGMNIQKRLLALHNLDAPWRPGDLEQRIGRIERQGNAWPEVFVCNYVTEGSFDGYIWQTLETKSRFIGQMRSGDVTIRAIDDISEVVLSAAEIKAIASGNPKVIRKVQLDAELTKLASLQSSYRDTHARMRTKLRDISWARERMAERRALLAAAQAAVAPYADAEFKAAIVKGALTNEAVAYTKRDAAGKALNAIALEVAAQAQTNKERVTRTVGSYHGLLIRAQANPHMGVADLFLAVEQPGAIEAVTGQPIKLGSDQGVFASVDWQIRDIPAAIGRIDAEGAKQDQEEAQITVALTLPWDQAERYAALQEELAALNAELSKPDAGGTAQPSRAHDTATNPSPHLSDATLEIVETSDVDASALTVAAALPQLPPAALPEPSDPAAMELAMAQLAAAHSLTAAEEAEIAAEASAIEAEAAAPALVETQEQPAAIEQPQISIVLTAADVARVVPASRSTLIFGSVEQIGRVKSKRARAAKQTATSAAGEALDLFALLDPPAQLQLALF
jgi:N12 class adenine-specific DNA methylase